MDGLEDRVPCATYTHARRLPMVLGKLGDWTPPFQLTMPQVVVLIVTVLVETQTWRFWAPQLPGVAATVVFITVPILLAWAVRHARVEGRSLARFAAGAITYLARPRSGRAGGRVYRQARPAVLARYRIYVEEGPTR
jgi:hypothetical protein